LEKIEMKKTLVALAAISAVTGAMAQATLYGNIDQAYVKSTTTVAGEQTANTTGIASYQMGGSQIGVKGEEDLGGGMKASFLHEMGVTSDVNSTPTTRQAYVGLSGGFGALRIGKQYSNAFGNLISSDPFGATGGTGALYVGQILLGNQGTSGDNPLRQDKAIQYDLPSFAPGLRIGLTKVASGTDTTDGSVAKTGDSTGYGVAYASGPFNIGFTSDSITAQEIAAVGDAVDDGSKTKLRTLAAGFDLGAAKVTFSDSRIMNDGQGVEVTMYAIAVPMGAATLMASQSNGKVVLTAGNTTLKGTQFGVNYALSKRTTAYWHANNSTSTTIANEVTKVKGYGIGLMHNF